jgi:hypothetical protein
MNHPILRERLRRCFVLFFLVACAAAFAGCASAGGYADYASAKSEAPGEFYAYGGEDEGGAGMAGLSAPKPAPEKKLQLVGDGLDGDSNAPADKPAQKTKITRVILYSADLGLFVFDFKKTLASAVEITKAEGGYVQASTSNSVTLRVPAAKFESVLEKLDKLGDANFRNVVGTDVTEEYLDLNIRLRNAEALRDRLAALLLQAKEVKDALAIEKELARVTGEIEQLKGRIRFLSDRAAFSVITLHLEPKTSEQVHVDHIPLPFGWLQQYGLGEVLQ